MVLPAIKKFSLIKKEIFEKEEYRFETQKTSPLILDYGSYIGLSILYQKMRNHLARIIAFEPDPDNLAILRPNIAANQPEDVTLIPKAVGDYYDNGTLDTARCEFVISAQIWYQ